MNWREFFAPSKKKILVFTLISLPLLSQAIYSSRIVGSCWGLVPKGCTDFQMFLQSIFLVIIFGILVTLLVKPEKRGNDFIGALGFLSGYLTFFLAKWALERVNPAIHPKAIMYPFLGAGVFILMSFPSYYWIWKKRKSLAIFKRSSAWKNFLKPTKLKVASLLVFLMLTFFNPFLFPFGVSLYGGLESFIFWPLLGYLLSILIVKKWRGKKPRFYWTYSYFNSIFPWALTGKNWT